MTAQPATQHIPQVYRVTFTEFNKKLNRMVYVVIIVEGFEEGGVERHRSTRFDREVAEQSAERWARANGYVITRRQAGEAIGK